MSQIIRIGLLGCSEIANRSILPAIIQNMRFDLIAVGSRSQEKAQIFSDKFICSAGTYQDILSDSSIDAVYVSLPVGLHYEWGKKVLQAGKHLLLEKTFTASLSEAQNIIQMAQTCGKVAMEALPYIYHPLFHRVRQVITSNQIGELRHIEAFFGFPYLPTGDIRNYAELGGGAILDALIYPLSFALRIGGIDYFDHTAKLVFDDKRGIDTRGFVQINWPNYAANLVYGFGFMYRNSYSVWGEKAYLTADRVFSRPSGLPAEIRIVRQEQVETIPVEAADQFGLMLDAFAEKITGIDDSELNEGNDVLARMRIISDVRDQLSNPTRRMRQG